MTDKQYCQLLRNRAHRRAKPVFAGALTGRLLAGAARSVRRRTAAEKALARILPDELVKVAEVESFEGGTVMVCVSGRTGWEQVQRAAPRLREQLIRALPGARRVRVRPKSELEWRHGQRRAREGKREASG
jgi:hypothetical protein